jgi:spore germination protein GerM
MEKKNLIILAGLFFLLMVLVVVYFNLGGKEKPRPVQLMPSSQEEAGSEGQVQRATVVLFFSSEKDDLLHREEREIIASSSVEDQARTIVLELLKGSQQENISPIPPETRLREVFIAKDGVAYVDFSREFMDKHLSGSSAEISTIYSVVNSLTFNIKSIKKVFILVDGGEKKTLGGHLDLTRPFSPLYDLVSQ